MGVTAGIVIVGNEILSGKVADTNSVFLARELRAVGAELCRVVVVADEIGEIAEVVRDFAQRFHVVFTSGGVGPTHDDVTIAGVAKGLGRTVVRHPEIETAAVASSATVIILERITFFHSPPSSTNRDEA